jgi:hypothetical protein
VAVDRRAEVLRLVWVLLGRAVSPMRCVRRTSGSSCSSRRTRSCAARRAICRRPTCRGNDVPARPRARRRRASRGPRPPRRRGGGRVPRWPRCPLEPPEIDSGGHRHGRAGPRRAIVMSMLGVWPLYPGVRLRAWTRLVAPGRAGRARPLLRMFRRI